MGHGTTSTLPTLRDGAIKIVWKLIPGKLNIWPPYITRPTHSGLNLFINALLQDFNSVKSKHWTLLSIHDHGNQDIESHHYSFSSNFMFHSCKRSYFNSFPAQITVCHLRYNRYRIRSHVLRDVSARSLQTTILGQPLNYPICVAPTAMHRFAHPEGEKATARGARHNRKDGGGKHNNFIKRYNW